MFNPGQYKDAHVRILGANSQEVTLHVNNGTGFDKYTGVKARVIRYDETTLPANSTIKIGDLKLIILADTVPAGLRALELKDRIEIAGKIHSVMMWDPFTGTVGGELISITAAVRG